MTTSIRPERFPVDATARQGPSLEHHATLHNVLGELIRAREINAAQGGAEFTPEEIDTFVRGRTRGAVSYADVASRFRGSSTTPGVHAGMANPSRSDAQPVLLKAISDIVKARARAKKAGAEPLSEAEMDEFIRSRTAGKFTFADARERLTVDPTRLDARNLGRSAAQGALFEWADELVNKVQPGAGDVMRERDRAFSAEHPIASGVARIAGMVPGGIASVGAKTAGKMIARGAATGAVGGAVASAGAADEGGRMDAATSGAVLGGLLGGAFPAVATGVRALRPSARAARRVGNAVTASGGAKALLAKLNEFQVGGKADQVMLGDLSRRLRLETDFAANASDDVLAPLSQRVAERQAGQAERLLGDAQDVLVASPDAAQRLEALRTSRQAWAKSPKGYAGLRARNPAINAGDLARGMQVPEVRAAWRAARLAGDITEDNVPVALRSVFVQPKLGGRTIRPASFADLHDFRQLVDDKATAAFNGGRGNLGSAYATLRDKIDDVMEESVPDYRPVRAEYAKRMGLERALEAGEEAWDVDDPRKLAQVVAKLSGPEIDEFRTGMASKFLARLGNRATNRDEATNLLNQSKALQAKLETVFGSRRKFDLFMQRVQQEGEMAQTRGAVGGSATARRLNNADFDPLEVGVSAAAGAPPVAAVQGFLARLSGRTMARSTGREMGPYLMASGVSGIEDALRKIGVRSRPAMGARAQVGAGLVAARLPSLLFDRE